MRPSVLEKSAQDKLRERQYSRQGQAKALIVGLRGGQGASVSIGMPENKTGQWLAKRREGFEGLRGG